MRAHFLALVPVALAMALSLSCGGGGDTSPPPGVADSGPSAHDASTGSPVDAAAAPVPILHAHNDYEHPRPLLDALEQGFASVEADVHERSGVVHVAHDLDETKGTLEALYLDPLAARVKARGGAVHEAGKPFYLWIDLKEESPELKAALAKTLARYDFLATFGAGGDASRAVTVVLTGSRAKVELVRDTPAPRPFVRDSNDFSATDPEADEGWAYYALPFLSLGLWDGEGALPDGIRAKMKAQLDGAHGLGRKVRYYGAPDTSAYWNEARALGVDFLGTDDLAGLAKEMGAKP